MQIQAQKGAKNEKARAKAAGTQFEILLSGYGGHAHGLTAFSFTLHAPAGVHIRFFDTQRGGA